MSKSFYKRERWRRPPPYKGRGGGQRTPTCEMRMSANCSFIEITVSEPRDSSSTSSYGSCCGTKKKEKKQRTSFSACVVCVVRFWRIRACGYRGDSAREEEPPPEGGVPADALVQQVAGEERVRLFPVPVAVTVSYTAHAHEERCGRGRGGAFATMSSYLSAV